MKKLWQSFTLATAMYSKLPTPRTNWDSDSMSLVFCFFPWIGLVIGAAELLWFQIAAWLQLSGLLFGVLAALIPVAITGGIHLDGFCDTCDALGSHQSRERKLEILKDTHTGAFALIGLVCYMAVYMALWAEVRPCAVLALIPVLSRALSGLCAVTMKNARGEGLLATFTNAMDQRRNQVVLIVWLILAAAACLLWALPEGAAILVGAAAAMVWYVVMSRRQFGGITGDLAGWFVQICELLTLAAVVLLQKGMVVLG